MILDFRFRILDYVRLMPGALVLIVLGFSAAAAQSDGSQQNVMGKAGTFAIVGARIVTV